MNNQQIVIMFLSSFVGCLAALTVFGIIAGIIAFPMMDATISQLAIRVEGEINNAEIVCTDTYIDGAIPIIISDQREYCKVTRQT